MRTHVGFASSVVLTLFLVLAASGCGGGDPDPGVDAGFDAGGGGGIDAGRDAGPPPSDTGPLPDSNPSFDSGPILPPIDGGDPFGDAGALGAPPWVDLDVRVDGTECDPLVACGGDVVGTWDVAGGCVEVPIPEQLMECPGAEVNVTTHRARGRVTFGATTSTRTAQSEIVVEVFVPGLCASFVGGCPGIESMIQAMNPDARCVTDDAGGHCNCAVRNFNLIDDTDGYSIDTDTIVSATLGKRWDYCIAGADMRYEDVSTSGPTEPGIIELVRRLAEP
jgi:hypothetical protein